MELALDEARNYARVVERSYRGRIDEEQAITLLLGKEPDKRVFGQD